MIDLARLTQVAREAGFEVAGVAPVEAAGHGWYAPHAERLRAWLAAGHHAQMDWIAERAGERLVPEQLLPGVQSAIVLFAAHRTPDLPRPAHETGRVARYAWGRDYHNLARKGLRRVRRWLSEHHPEARTYGCVDTGPVMERAWFERANVGWIGRSTMLIHPRLGTFGSLAVLFCDVALPAAAEAHPMRCGTCTDCVDRCPTGAIGPLGVDARRCISYWTIEHRGALPAEVRPWIGEWLLGCDICQDVCPWNHKAPRASTDRWRPQPARAWPDLAAWIRTDTDTLHASLEGSPLLRAGGASLRRNAMVVAANTGAVGCIPALWGVLRYDPDPDLRGLAAWALRALGDPAAADEARRDFDPRVQAEAHSPLPADAGAHFPDPTEIIWDSPASPPPSPLEAEP